MEEDTHYLEQASKEMEEQAEIRKLQEELYRNTGLRRSEEEENRDILFFPEDDKHIGSKPGEEMSMKKPKEVQRTELIKNGVDKIITNLSHTLGDIGFDSIEQANLSPEERRDYLTVAKTVNHIAAAIKETGLGTIRYVRDLAREAKIAERGVSDGKHAADRVYLYKARNVTVNGYFYTAVEFFIRPHKYVREISTKSGGKMIESRQARTTITIQSPDLPQGTASIRIDPPSPYSKGRLTYDVIVGGDSDNIMENLDLGKAGQTAGHHFESVYDTQDLKMTTNDVHEAIAARLEHLTPATHHSTDIA